MSSAEIGPGNKPNPNLLRNGQYMENGRPVGAVQTFEDPYLLGQVAWREIIRYQMYSVLPVPIGLIGHDGQTQTLSAEDLSRARRLSPKSREEFLDEWSFEAYESKQVSMAIRILGKSNSS